jgi:hypothetical protein
MGLGLGFRFSRSSYDSGPVIPNEPEDLPNPDPKNFRIRRSEQIGRMLLIEVNYPDCTNYEGNKILLYKDVTMDQLERQGSIDPHFSENVKFASPIARFVPTEEGWMWAKVVASA